MKKMAAFPSLIFISFIGIHIYATQSYASFPADMIGGNTVSHASPEEKEYRDIFSIPRFNDFNMSVSFEERWRKYCDTYIKAFQNFIQKYPKSVFTPEAKLRIAERYHISYRKDEALKWLDDIIKNHPGDAYYSLRGKYNGGEKTAAWALYYRGKWFNRNEDFRKLLSIYPESNILDDKERSIYPKIILLPSPPSRK